MIIYLQFHTLARKKINVTVMPCFGCQDHQILKVQPAGRTISKNSLLR